jgi:hypothetical protein
MEPRVDTDASNQIDNPKEKRFDNWRVRMIRHAERVVGYMKRKAAKRRTKHQQETAADKVARKTATATIWIAVFSFLLAGAASYQFIILNSQLNVMRKDQRAWISITVPKIKLSVDDPRLHIRSIKVTNTGKTPAKNIVADFFVEVVSNGSQPHFGGGIAYSAEGGQ